MGLALRWAKSGLRVRIGSRAEERAQAAAQHVRTAAPEARVEGFLNPQAAAEADVVVLTVPLVAQIATLRSVRESLRPGTILVDATVPLGNAVGDRIGHVLALWAGSAAQQAAAFAPKEVSVVSAFHCLSAVALADLEHPVDCDVLICGDSAEAKARVKELVERIPGARAVDSGPLENSRFSEVASALLISLNVRHKVKHSGLRITGLPV